MLALAFVLLFVVTGRDQPFLTLMPDEKVMIFATMLFIVAIYPAMTFLIHACTPRVQLRALAYVLSTMSVLALLFLIILPYLPEPGSEYSVAVCLDWGSTPPALRFDATKVKGGPCLSLGVETIAMPSAPSAKDSGRFGR